MAVPRVSVRVDYTQTENKITSVDFGNTYASWSEVKDSTYPNSLSTISDGAKPFILGKSTLGTGATYIKTYDGYMSNVLSTATPYSGDVSLGYTIPNGGIKITVKSADAIKNLILYFDRVSGEYPIVIDVQSNGQTVSYENADRAMFTWGDIESESDTVVVTLKSWSHPNSLIRITGLVDGLAVTYNRTNGLMGVSVKMQSTTSDLPEYGCIGKTDSIRLYDKDYQIQQLAERGFLGKNIPVAVFLNGNLVSSYRTASDWQANGREISVSIEDEIIGWSSIQLDLTDPPYKYIGLNVFSTTEVADNLWDLLIATLKKAGVTVDSSIHLGRIFCTDAVKSHLQSIKLGIWYQPEQLTLTDFVNNICTLGQVNIYIGLEDKIVISKI